MTSGYRDPQRNAQVGGAKGSQHIHGNAYDLDVSHMPTEQRIELIKRAKAAGFTGVGVYDNSLHFDVGPARAWGPSYGRESIPAWAAEAVGIPAGNVTMSTSGQTAPTGGDGNADLDALMPDDSPEANRRARASMMWSAIGKGLGQLSSGGGVDISSVVDAHMARQDEMRQRIAEIAMERRRRYERAESRGWQEADVAAERQNQRDMMVLQDTMQDENRQVEQAFQISQGDTAYGRQRELATLADQIGDENRTAEQDFTLGRDATAFNQNKEMFNLDQDATSRRAMEDLAATNAAVERGRAALAAINPALADIAAGATGKEGLTLVNNMLQAKGAQSIAVEQADKIAATEQTARRQETVAEAEGWLNNFKDSTDPNSGAFRQAAELVMSSGGRTPMLDALKAVTPDGEQSTIQLYEYRNNMTPEQQSNFDSFMKAKSGGVTVDMGTKFASEIMRANNETLQKQYQEMTTRTPELDRAQVAVNRGLTAMRMNPETGFEAEWTLPLKRLLADINDLSEEDMIKMSAQELLATIPPLLAPIYRGPGPQSDKDLEAIITASPGLGKDERTNMILLQSLDNQVKVERMKKEALAEWMSDPATQSDLNFDAAWEAAQRNHEVPQPFYIIEDDDTAAMALDAYDKSWLADGQLTFMPDASGNLTYVEVTPELVDYWKTGE